MVFLQHQVSGGSLDVMPEHYACLPGEVITGVVLLHLVQPLQSTTLTLALVGQEDVHAVHTDSEGDKSTTDNHHVLLNQSVQIGQGPLAAGDHAVPFSIPVPQGLPPTKTNARYLSGESDILLKILYTLNCSLTVHDAGVQSLKQDIAFTILAHPSVRPVGEPVEAQADRSFRYGFLTQKGTCAMRVAVPTNVVAKGARISAHVWFDLSAPERLRRITLSLQRKIHTTAANMRNHNNALAGICTTPFDRSLLSNLREFVLQLPVTVASAPQVDGERQIHEFHPTESFYDFRVTYQIVVECDVRGCSKFNVSIPVTFVPGEDVAAPIE